MEEESCHCEHSTVLLSQDGTLPSGGAEHPGGGCGYSGWAGLQTLAVLLDRREAVAGFGVLICLNHTAMSFVGLPRPLGHVQLVSVPLPLHRHTTLGPGGT